ncbi:hypothetical protein BDZ94DRAFT_1265425 [Collybia nuda]|uniref:Uncharacterized protein n=1 Tax=Collybia nuda TaxID=64659 RepID=A0A9P5Y3E8_9AGAR|nr:hypothetical protein BDZ94DRAFT_1265425 [Collybia nuda]
MAIRFQTFRQMLLALVIIISLASIILSSCLSPYFVHRKVFWMIIVVEGGSMIRSCWSGIRKPLLKKYQSVASENMELFIFLPFELVLALVTLTLPLVRGPTGKIVPTVLEILIIVNTTINIAYTTCLLAVAMLTAPAYDADVWIRDIDSCPSPFPIPIILSFVFSCISRWKPTVSAQAMDDAPLPPCLPGCNCDCTVKPAPPMMSQTISSVDRLVAPSTRLSAPITGSRIPSHQSLVRIPDAAERRASIIVAFDV